MFYQQNGNGQGYNPSGKVCDVAVCVCEVNFIRLLVDLRMWDLAYRLCQAGRYVDDVLSRYYSYFRFFSFMVGESLVIGDTNEEDRNSAEFLDTKVYVERLGDGKVGRLVVTPFAKRDKYPLLQRLGSGEMGKVLVGERGVSQGRVSEVGEGLSATLIEVAADREYREHLRRESVKQSGAPMGLPIVLDLRVRYVDDVHKTFRTYVDDKCCGGWVGWGC